MNRVLNGGKRLVEIAGASILTMSITLGPCFLKSNQLANRISSEEQAEIIASALDCDLSYMKYNQTKGITRMVHNDSEPIYVNISDNVKQEESLIIEESLDYVFGIVNQINPHYEYKIVEYDEFNAQKILGKTTIEYQEGVILSNTLASMNKKENGFEKFSTSDYYSTFKITYDRNLFENLSYDEKLYVFIHELLHAFGLDDIYTYGERKTTDVNHKNTMMLGYGASGSVLTPNDLKCLLSAYAEQYTKQELEEYIFKAKQIAEIYQEYYYQNRVEKIKESEQKEFINLDGQNVYSKFSASLTTLSSSLNSQNIIVKIVGNEYIVEISGGGRDKISIAKGKVIEVDGVKVLQNVKFSGTFEHGLKKENEQTIMDLYLVRCESCDMIYDASNLIYYKGENLEQNLER